MFSQVSTALLILASIAHVAIGWQNSWDRPLNVDCHSKALYMVQSIHDNHREDRRFHFHCKNIGRRARYNRCYWTGYENQFDQPLQFQCGVNYVMTGVSSYHDNHREDRRWRFKCCQAQGYYTKNCGLTGYINDWDAYMYHRAGGKKVFVGAFSYHDNRKEDRRWKILECDYSRR